MEYNLLILASGKGSRMMPLTDNLAKPCVNVAGKSLLGRMILSARGLQFTPRNIFVNVSYASESVVDTLIKEELSTGIEFLWEQNILGSAHTLWSAHKQFGGNFAVIHGDLLLDNNCLANIIAQLSDLPPRSTIFYHYRLAYQARSELVIQENGEVVSFFEGFSKASTSVASNSGIYYFKDCDLNTVEVPSLGVQISRHYIPALIQSKLLSGVEFKCKYRKSIETPSDFFSANLFAAENPNLFSI